MNDIDELNNKNRSIWNTNSSHWDNYMGEDGNHWHKNLIAPFTEDLLGLNTNDNLLDIGCGNGLFARRMSKKV